MKNKVILTLSTVILSISLFIVPAQAKTYNGSPTNVSYTPYGTVTKEYYAAATGAGNAVQLSFLGISIPVSAGHISTLVYEFNYPADFTVKCNFFDNLSDTNYQVFINGASIISWDNTGITVMGRNSKRFEITIILPNQSVYAHQMWLGVTNSSVEFLSGDVTIDGFDDLLSYAEITSDGITELTADIDDILEAIGDDIIPDLESLINAMSTCNVSLAALNVPNYSHGFYRILTGNDTTKIKEDIYGNYIEYSNSNTLSTYLYNGSTQCMIYEADANNIYPVFTNTNITATVQRTMRVTGGCVYYVEISNAAGNGNYSFTFNNSATVRRIYPFYFGYRVTIPNDLMWACRGYYNDAYTSKLDDVISAINNMELNVNNMTVNVTGMTYNVNQSDVNNSITEYNSNITTVYNVENNLQLSFEDRIEDISVNPLYFTSITRPANYMNNIITDIGDLNFVKYPLTIYLIGIVLIAMLG